MQIKKTCLTLFLSLAFLCFHSYLFAQKDTEFWFVAPEISQNNTSNFDRPVAFRFSTYGAAATVTVSQPANPAFPVQNINIAANTSGALMLPPLFQFVENTPANTVNNKGFLIQSTAPITAYYEIIGSTPNNPELFSLKGKNALGTLFYTPFQNITDNSAAYTPLPKAAFDIVGTEDNTTVTITPTQALVGRPANIPFNITLQKGQTWSGEALSQLGVLRPTGSKIQSDKPIAVTIKDDLLESGWVFGGFCRDVMSDQLVPVDKLGTRYVVHKGLLNGNEYAFIMATENGTQVSLDGVVIGNNLNEGEMLNLTITNGGHFIESSAPVYVWQMTGQNCEVAGEIMPALDCSGSSSVRFVRSTPETFHLFLTTRNGFQDGFILNGNPNLILPGAFQVVPGTGGEFVAAAISFDDNIVPAGQSSIVSNTQGLFQMGFLNGGLTTGCRYGFFSDFGNKVLVENTIPLCAGETVQIEGQLFTAPAQLEFIHPGLNGTCDSSFVYSLVLKDDVSINANIPLCPGETVVLGGQTYTAPATVNLTLAGQGNACDTLATYQLILKPQESFTQNIPLCPGETVVLGGQTYTAPATVNLTLAGQGNACDTLATYVLTTSPQPTVTRIIEFCPGETITLGGISYTQPGTVTLLLPASTGCDTLATYTLASLTPSPSNVGIVCPNNISLATLPGTGPVAVTYALPQAATDCPCPGLELDLIQGLASGNIFPVASTQVCWQASDSCGQTASCCFLVTIREEQPCDVKISGCVKYELLNITADAGNNKTYRVRVTNNCPNRLIYTAIQVPDGMTAMYPADNSVYESPVSGRDYEVRSPNFSPMYSVRFKSTSDSIAGGESDIFRYKLPAQADVTFIDIVSRLEPQIFLEAHLNTFYCPVGVTPAGERPVEERLAELTSPTLRMFPNPTTGVLYLDLADWNGQWLNIRLMDVNGKTVVSRNATVDGDLLQWNLPEQIAAGLYFVEIQAPGGEKVVERVALLR